MHVAHVLEHRLGQAPLQGGVSLAALLLRPYNLVHIGAELDVDQRLALHRVANGPDLRREEDGGKTVTGRQWQDDQRDGVKTITGRRCRDYQRETVPRRSKGHGNMIKEDGDKTIKARRWQDDHMDTGLTLAISG